MNNKGVFNDKFMLVDRSKEGVAMAEFYDSHLGLALSVENYQPQCLSHLTVLKRRHDHATSWRNVGVVPRFYLSLGSGMYSHFYLQPFDTSREQIPFPVPKDGELYDAVRTEYIEFIYEILLSDYTPMLESLNLIHVLNPTE